MTGAALISGKYQNFYMNDLRDTPKLFLDAMLGKYKDEKRWISREEFFKSTDPYVKYCWGFGNKGTSYMYSKDLEPYKEALWKAVVNDQTINGKKGYCRVLIQKYENTTDSN